MAEEYVLIRGFDFEKGKSHEEKRLLVEKMIKSEWDEVSSVNTAAEWFQ